MPARFYNRQKIKLIALLLILLVFALLGRLFYVMIFKSEYYQIKADDLHERERAIKAKRGVIYDRNGVALATNTSVCTVTVIHNQITDAKQVIEVLSTELDIDEAQVREKVEKVTSIETIKSNIPKEKGDVIRSYKLDGVNVDEDYARHYPFDDLASKVIGFTGSDNQGIIGLEVIYDEYLKGTKGQILTTTDVRGIEVENAAETRINPLNGSDLYTSIDYNIQTYTQQVADKMMTQKEAQGVSIILMDPQNGEILAMVNSPEFDLNEPYTLNIDVDENSMENFNDLLNQMWRNDSINDTYEPGSTFKIITSTAALEEGLVSLSETFSCPGFRVVEDRRIRCHKTTGHGSETFVEGFMNSCNPVFMDIGARVGIEKLYQYFDKLGLFNKTGVDLPGESGSIMHQVDNVGAVELATVSFGQSFQITPLQLLVAASAIVNGGDLVTPHFGMKVVNEAKDTVNELSFETEKNVVSKETSATMKELLELVVSEGTGKNAYIEGYSIGGKTATSQKLPRSEHKYIASFIGFAPADDPKIIGIVLIDEPVGTYYGGTIAAPVMREIFENVLPYMGIERAATVESEESLP